MSCKKGHRGHAGWLDNLSAEETKLGGSSSLHLPSMSTRSFAGLHNERFSGNSWIDPMTKKDFTSGSRESAAISTPETVLTVVFGILGKG